MDINACIHHLGLNANRYRLTQSPPPHEFISWHEDNPDPQPTQEELEAAWAEIADDIAWKPVREKRNALLDISDYALLSDAPYSQSKKKAWKTYRQELRDIPQIFSDIEAVEWPDKPDA